MFLLTLKLDYLCIISTHAEEHDHQALHKLVYAALPSASAIKAKRNVLKFTLFVLLFFFKFKSSLK